MNARNVDPARVAELMRAVAAEVVLPRFNTLREGDVREKKEGELVTIADLESEEWLARRLHDLLPGSTIVGEEAVFADPAVLHRLEDSIPAWIIDPIDGTWNFAHGRTNFCIIVALAVAGDVVAGWIHEPVSGNLAMGRKGEGVIFNGVPVRFAADDGAPATGTAARHLRERADASAEVAKVYRTSCAGHEYMAIFAGTRDFSAYTRLMPWDHAAGSLMIREAGGRSALLSSEDYDVARPSGELLSARSDGLWRRLHAALSGTAPD